MYAICSIIYGIPITEELYPVIKDENDELFKKYPDLPEMAGFETMYSGGSNIQPGYLGVELDEFDECCDAMAVSSLRMKPTQEELEKVAAMVKDLPQEVIDVALPVDVYFVWSTS